MSLGVFGGTFNPIHHGHLISARCVQEEFGLESILFIPSKRPVHKDIRDQVSSEDRYRMLEIATEGNGDFRCSRIEIDRDAPSYTIITVEELLRTGPDRDLYLIIGYDSYLELDTWYEYPRLAGLVTFIVMNRPHDGPGREGQHTRERLFFAHNPMIEISSSCIRERVRSDKPVHYLVPEGVEHYIKQRGLYRS